MYFYFLYPVTFVRSCSWLIETSANCQPKYVRYHGWQFWQSQFIYFWKMLLWVLQNLIHLNVEFILLILLTHLLRLKFKSNSFLESSPSGLLLGTLIFAHDLRILLTLNLCTNLKSFCKDDLGIHSCLFHPKIILVHAKPKSGRIGPR